MEKRGLTRLLVPTLSDFLFCAFLLWLFVGTPEWKKLLGDGDTGWHTRTGEYILDHGTVPQKDLFSFTRPNKPWYAWEWLADILMALAHRTWGLAGLALGTGVLLALVALLLFRRMMSGGGHLLISLLATLLAMGASTVHFLARPHVFTILFMAISAWLLDADRRRPGRAIWWLVPLSALWANLHAGFLALYACIAIQGIGLLLEGGADRVRSFLRYTAIGAACAAATLVNPYTYQLHVHAFEFLRWPWMMEFIAELQSPQFRTENALQFEVLLFAGVATAGLLIARKRFVEALMILFWAHHSLKSVRHIPLYAIIAAPWIAEEMSALLSRAVRAMPSTSVGRILEDLSREFGRTASRNTVWPVVAVLLIALTKSDWPTDLPADTFPVNLVTKHAALLCPPGGPPPRILNSDQWGSYLIYRFYPRLPIYIDGRLDFYGPDYGQEYLSLVGGKHRWEQILAQYQFQIALLPTHWPLSELLKQHPQWTRIDGDDRGVLFVRSTKDFPAPSDISHEVLERAK